MSDASIDQLVCKPTNGRTRIAFNRYISDGNSCDDVLVEEESDDNKTSESMEDMANELKQFEDAGASANKRSPSFLFQRVADKLEKEHRARRNQSMKEFLNDADLSLNNKGAIDTSSSTKSPFDGLPKMIQVLHKSLSSCLLLSLPSIISLCLAVILLLRVQNDSGNEGIPSTAPSSLILTNAPSTVPISAPPVGTIASRNVTFNNTDDSPSIAATTSLPESITKKMGSVIGSSDVTEVTTSTEEGSQLIGLIDSPMDPDELLLLVETNPGFLRAVNRQNEQHLPALQMSAVREIITGDGSTIYCNARVEEIAIVVECRVNEEVCRVYDGTANTNLCDDGEKSS